MSSNSTSNSTDYDNNWTFQLHKTKNSYLKILAGEDLILTHYLKDGVPTTLQRQITNDHPDAQRYILCEDCPGDQ